jgi:hypothetical protein
VKVSKLVYYQSSLILFISNLSYLKVLNHGVEPAKEHHLSDKPPLVGNMGLLCVKHLPMKYTTVAVAIRDTIYDPDFYDDGEL